MQIFDLIKRIGKKIIFRARLTYALITGENVECNLCHHRALRFKSDNWHLYCTCPKCYASIRQRLLIASLTLLKDLSYDKIIRNKKVLHFAPEISVGKLIKNIAKEYKTADFFAEGYSYDNIDYNLDISNMKNIADESFDCVIACDVLEHVPDHIQGIKEVYRILNKDGYCIFTVPQKDKLEKTFEDNSITDKIQREKIFGQFDHLRIYGDDFKSTLQKCGFTVTAVSEQHFDTRIVKKFVLFPPILSKHPLATNYRKVFFGKKT